MKLSLVQYTILYKLVLLLTPYAAYYDFQLTYPAKISLLSCENLIEKAQNLESSGLRRENSIMLFYDYVGQKTQNASKTEISQNYNLKALIPSFRSAQINVHNQMLLQLYLKHLQNI